MVLSLAEQERLNLEAALDHAIDARGLEYVVEVLAGLCFIRSDNAGNQQDEAMAEQWARAGSAFAHALEQAARVSPRQAVRR